MSEMDQIKICALVDVMGTFDKGPKEEYSEMQAWFQAVLRQDCAFETDVFPHNLDNKHTD